VIKAKGPSYNEQVVRKKEVIMLENGFPEIITSLPEADINFEGVRGWISQGEEHQIVFFHMEPMGEASEHSHDYPQWGIVVEGRMELIINGKSRMCEKGDEYVIPALAKHSARFLTSCRIIDFFREKERFKPKPVS
jgi:quercetin dioxygenase-like cupin family protein